MMIFFDIDETLVDQRAAERTAAEKLLALYAGDLARRYSLGEFCSLWRALREKHAPAFFCGAITAEEQRRRRVRELFARCGRLLTDREVDRCIEFYEDHYRRSWRLFDDVKPALARLKNFRCGVISNGSSAQQNLKLQQTGIAAHFELVVVSEDAGAAKPERGIFLAACRRAGLLPAQCIYVGDRFDQDTVPSRSLGMCAYWLRRRESGAPADPGVIASLAELPPRLPHGSAA